MVPAGRQHALVVRTSRSIKRLISGQSRVTGYTRPTFPLSHLAPLGTCLAFAPCVYTLFTRFLPFFPPTCISLPIYPPPEPSFSQPRAFKPPRVLSVLLQPRQPLLLLRERYQRHDATRRHPRGSSVSVAHARTHAALFVRDTARPEIRERKKKRGRREKGTGRTKARL